MIKLYYHRSINFGDMLSLYLCSKMSGVSYDEIETANFYEDSHKFILTGSLLGSDKIKNATIFGAGFAYSNSYFCAENVNIAMVRGNLSLTKIIEQKNQHGNYVNNIDTTHPIGEPSIILPHYYNPLPDKKYKIGIIPHIVEYKKVYEKYKNYNDIIVIDSRWNPNIEGVEEFVNRIIFEISLCEQTLSSSLHGLIVSTAYSIPTDWCKFSDGKIVGDGFKYYDYIYSITDEYTNENPINCHNYINMPSIELIIENNRCIYNTKINSENLLNKNPF